MKQEEDVMADIRVPTLGESVTEATVGKWFKRPGDAVAVDEPLVELRDRQGHAGSARAGGGHSLDIAVKDGDTVAVGALLGQIKEGAGAAPKAAPAPIPQKAAEQPKPSAAAPARSTEMPMPPSVRKMAAESGVDPQRSPAAACTGRSRRAT